MDPSSLVTLISEFEASVVCQIVTEVLQKRPELAPAVVNVLVPDLTYAPVKAVTERRCCGVIKMADATGKGYGFISCPELYQVFGNDVFVHRKQIAHCYPGQEVNFAVLLNKENKPQAFDIVEGRTKDGDPIDSRGFGKGCSGKNGKGGGGCHMMGDMHGMGGGMCGAMGGGMCGNMGMGGMHGMRGMGMGGCGCGMHGMGMMGMDQGMMMPMHMGMMGGMGGMGGMCGMGCKGDRGMGDMGCDGGKGSGKDDIGKSGRHRMTALGVCVGVVKSFNQEKGYGFVMSPDIATYGIDGDAYLHISQKGEFDVGSEVAFTLHLLNGRPQARDLKYPALAQAESRHAEAFGQAEREMMGQLHMAANMGGATSSGQGGGYGGGCGGGCRAGEQVLGTWMGFIKSYNHEKKFGFISCPELNARSGAQGDVYLHERVMHGFAVGNVVTFTAILREGRLQGRDLQHAPGEQAPKRMRTE